ncbi:MAG TPA: hypothetical protein ENJ09_04745 [Planctomycetes bacterium]|nr:hypothetical protein [Planctomycetota bacterium]
MKASLLAACSLAALLLLSSLGTSPVGASFQEDEPAARQTPPDLTQRIAELESRVEELERARKADSARLDGVLRFLEAQRKAARSMESALDRVNELGFTKGINYSSRELLLETLRAQAKALEAPLPKANPSPAKPGARGR